ncbi:MAG TPA: hypothetical protein VLA97_13165 [Nocardioidaceae bacterium]|jgi:hypothetical protein|nr:hypothetical protein [Nocardioidaceae bacterium]
MSEDSQVSRSQLEAQLLEGQMLAPTLIGLPLDFARDMVTGRGHVVEVVRPGDELVTADLRHDRIRLFTEGDDVVHRAEAG